MKEYKKSVLEYRDVRDSIELAREEAHEEGVKKGIKKGIEKERISIIHKCLQNNIPVDVIINLTGFSKVQINRYSVNRRG
jgi:predicted transposase/invertase (TIGR01784 family)